MHSFWMIQANIAHDLRAPKTIFFTHALWKYEGFKRVLISEQFFSFAYYSTNLSFLKGPISFLLYLLQSSFALFFSSLSVSSLSFFVD